MKEYIEREAALSAQNKSMNLSECRKRIERIPAADVRPVVRCKDCAHRHDDGFCAGRGWPMQLVPDDGFCNCGARLDATDMVVGSKGGGTE